MGLFLIFAGLLIIGIALIVISSHYGWYIGECIGVVGTAIFGLAVVACSIIAILISGCRQVEYQKYELQYQTITKKLQESEENYYLLVGDINEYNNAILEDRYWADNVWVNWYQNGLIKDLPLIGE